MAIKSKRRSNSTCAKKKSIFHRWRFLTAIVVLVISSTTIFGCSSSSHSDNPLLDLKIEYWPVKNGAGTETIGKWASITVDKETFANATSEQFREFCDSKVFNRDYNWFTVFFDDGTGLKLGDSMPVEYGRVTQDGAIEETIEIYYCDEDGSYKPVPGE